MKHSRAWAPEGQIATKVLRKTPPGVEPMSLIPREARERREDRDRERSESPSPEERTREEETYEEGTREVRVTDDQSEDSEDRRDDRRKRFRYEEPSPDSEMNFIGQGQQQPLQPESSKAALNVVWGKSGQWSRHFMLARGVVPGKRFSG